LRCATEGWVVSNSFANRPSVLTSLTSFGREERLVIEVDGGQHADNPRDRTRDTALSAAGYRVLRFWNSEILANEEGVLSVILAKLQHGET
jgi:very-short-patch-repair endonuclease